MTTHPAPDSAWDGQIILMPNIDFRFMIVPMEVARKAVDFVRRFDAGEDVIAECDLSTARVIHP